MGIIFSNIIAIYRRELQSYFTSPLAYAIAAIFWLLSGYFFVAILLGEQGILQQVAAAEVQTQQTGQPLPPIDVAYEFLRSFLSVMSSLALFILPILSMGLYAEERKRGTLELLATSPVTNWAVAVGKLLGVVTFFTVLILPLFAYEAITFSAANPPVPSIDSIGGGDIVFRNVYFFPHRQHNFGGNYDLWLNYVVVDY
jgi:ABC-2 type transport system permease protein